MVMYTIAICDDEVSSVADIHRLLRRYQAANPGYDYRTDDFHHSIDMMGALEKESYDIYFLDIHIDRISGIEIAEMIMKKPDHGDVILMSKSDHHYKEAFQLEVTGYLEKPIGEAEFFSALEKVGARNCSKVITIRNADGVARINQENIVCIRSMDHYKRIETTTQNYMVRSTMASLMEKLPGKDFYPLNTRIVINLGQVSNITRKEIVMQNGTTFRVPRGAYSKVVDQMFQR